MYLIKIFEKKIDIDNDVANGTIVNNCIDILEVLFNIMIAE